MSHHSIGDCKADSPNDDKVSKDVDVVLQQVGLQVVPSRSQGVHRQRVEDHPKAQPELELKKKSELFVKNKKLNSLHSGGSNTEHSKSESIRKLNVLKVGFRRVPFSNVRNHSYEPIIRKPNFPKWLL